MREASKYVPGCLIEHSSTTVISTLLLIILTNAIRKFIVCNRHHASSLSLRFYANIFHWKSEATQGLQDMNGGVCVYAASCLSHICVIKSNLRTLLLGRRCKLLFLPAFKTTLGCSLFLASRCGFVLC